MDSTHHGKQHHDPLRRFVLFTIVAVAATTILFFPSRFARFVLPDYSYVNKLFILLGVLSVLSPLALVARLIREPRTIRIGFSISAFFLILRCILDVMERINALHSWPLFGELTTFEESLRLLCLWVGATFLLGTLYLSIFELFKARRRAEAACLELTKQGLEEQAFSDRLAELHQVQLRLSGAHSVDELCRLAIQSGEGRLGFSGMTLWLRGEPQNRSRAGASAERLFSGEAGEAPSPGEVPEAWRAMLAGDVDSLLLPEVSREGTEVSRGRLLARLRDGDEVLGLAALEVSPCSETAMERERRLAVLFAGVIANLCRKKRDDAEREWLMSALEQSEETVIITDTEGIIQYVNPAFERSTGYTREEAVGRHSRLVKSGHQNEAFYQELWQTISGGKNWQGRLVNRRKDGSLYTEEVNISPVRNGNGSIVHYVGVKSDITARLSLETQFQLAQKMESIGRLAGGVAHDFNNMLAVILAQTEFALEQVEPSQQLYSDLKEIQKAAQRSAELTRQLLGFARKQVMAPKVLDLNDTIAQTLNLLRRMIGEDISLSWQPRAELWKVKMDPGQVQQILTNLCLNSRDAISGVGTLSLETSNIEISDAESKRHPQHIAGEFVMLRVEDSGCGMDQETLAHLFEPFYTTKGIREGTGLGLATVYGIVTQNKGFITVSSAPGEGTTFQIYLPRHTEAAAAVPKAGTPDAQEASGATVLLVEDEPSLLLLCTSMLRRLGYRVLSAGTPGEALRIAEKHPAEIDLLLTDVILPEMHGRKLARQLMRKHPGIKCVFMSGYTADVIAPQGAADELSLFLQKPFTSAELGAALRAALRPEPSR